MQSKVPGVSSHTVCGTCCSASVPRSVTHKLLHAPLPGLCLSAKAFRSVAHLWSRIRGKKGVFMAGCSRLGCFVSLLKGVVVPFGVRGLSIQLSHGMLWREFPLQWEFGCLWGLISASPSLRALFCSSPAPFHAQAAHGATGFYAQHSIFAQLSLQEKLQGSYKINKATIKAMSY